MIRSRKATAMARLRSTPKTARTSTNAASTPPRPPGVGRISESEMAATVKRAASGPTPGTLRARTTKYRRAASADQARPVRRISAGADGTEDGEADPSQVKDAVDNRRDAVTEDEEARGGQQQNETQQVYDPLRDDGAHGARERDAVLTLQ